ncbi:hypothetical protein [Zymomonas sp.]|uniref:hypothetical protein n=1 Tax=Zymomonas sp. TaxID=2068624 RepID=UPI0025E75193|nr:hypothetical protein [Zymomonas sp.]MCA1956868.1 hypothetical protein [Zymomonas sp.]
MAPPNIRTNWLWYALGLLLFAVAIRWQTFGNPLLHQDEDFYLFVGGRILKGDLPFVDIWDRKPIGLFLLYSFFHLFGPWRVLAYQIGALLSLWGTSLLVIRIASFIAPFGGALLAGFMYEAWPSIAGGEGGQAPIFYNLLVASAMALIICRLQRLSDKNTLRSTGTVVMLLFGIALQIKYTVLFEGIFAGIFLLWTGWHTNKSIKELSINAFLWITSALLPTATVFLFYILKGHGYDWYFANILSIFYRGHYPSTILKQYAFNAFLLTAPLLVCRLIRKPMGITFSKSQQNYAYFLDLWLIVAIFGVVLFEPWNKHYTLPLFAPLAIAAAPIWRNYWGKIGLLLLLASVAIKGEIFTYKHIKTHGDKQDLMQIKAAIRDPKGCVFIYNELISLYDMLPYCKLTTHPFPTHFNYLMEERATNINPVQEIHHILDQKPEYIVISDPFFTKGVSIEEVYSILSNDIRYNYTPIYKYYFNNNKNVKKKKKTP